MKEKIVSFEEFQKKQKEREEKKNQNISTLVWLHCQNCNTYEVTHIIAPHGRKHKACGEMAKEIECEVDLNAELTVSLFNMAILYAMLEKIKEKECADEDILINSIQKRIEHINSYIEILEKANTKELKVLDFKTEEELRPFYHCKEESGLLTTEFNHDLEKKFKDFFE